MDHITTEQLIKEVVAMGYEISTGSINDYHFVEIVNNSNNIVIATVTQDQRMQLDTMYLGWDDLNDQDKSKLYNLLDRYARTPLDKRETEKRYRLKLDVSSRIENNWQILAKNVDDGCCHIGSGRGSEKWQTVFTQSEIDEMGDLTKGFVKEEV